MEVQHNLNICNRLQRLQELQAAADHIGLSHAWPYPAPRARSKLEGCVPCCNSSSSRTSDLGGSLPQFRPANATADVSDDAIHHLEEQRTQNSLQQSLAVAERDPWFRPRLKHLTTFLRNQPNSPGGRGLPPLAAALVVETVVPRGASDSSKLKNPAPLVPSTDSLTVRVARANRIDVSGACYSPRARKTLGVCFTCPNKWVT